MTRPPPLRGFLLITAAFHLLLLGSAQGFGRSFYRSAEITIEKVESRDDGTLRISYRSMPETLYFSPGVNARTTKRGIELTFVRSHFKKKAKADYLAQTARDGGPLTRTVTIPPKGAAVFMKDGDNLVRIHPRPGQE